ncbi:MAG TPA: S16 family serine protease, partial [Thermoanaerobaculia bacterium]
MEENATSSAEESLRYATVLAEIGELYDAELAVAEALEREPESIPALDLLAKIKHMRGELSAAIGCWAQVHAKTHPGEAALMRLSSMLQLASEEKSNSHFVVLGPFQLWRKPAAHLELEEVFRLFLARRPDEAQERCGELARKYAGKDPALYKLSVLAKAWIAEMSGDWDGARRILEDLGSERGFETDDDRILALARVYERIGTPELLESAVHIYRHCEQRLDGISILGHLALLYRRLGRQDEAGGYEKRFLALFRKRMHRPSFADVVAAAARRYVPLSKLVALGLSEKEPPESPTPRERAITRALCGDRAGAEELLRDASEPLDRKYVADLAALEGDLEKAERLYLESVGADPGDSRTIEWLLNRFEATHSGQIAHRFRNSDWAAGAEAVLESALRRAPQRGSLWRQKAALARIMGRDEEAARLEERANALETAQARTRSTVGRALADAVYHFVGRAKGLIHEVWAARKPAGPERGGFLEEILGNLTPELTQTVRNTFLSVREYARAKWPHRTGDILDYNYTYKATKEDEPSGGLSAGLPSAIAFLSVFLNRPIPQDIASSGILIADAHDVDVLRPVGEVAYKVRGAYNRNLRRVILPEGNRAELAASPLVPAAVCQEIVAYAANLDDAVVLTFGEDVW